MKIVTYNVNGIKARLPRLLEYLEEQQPDAVCLQELKAPDEGFPADAIAALGYGAVWHGQKSWNGVAILTKGSEPRLRRTGLPGDPDDSHSRYIEAEIATTDTDGPAGSGDPLILGCLYLPNGNPQPGPKFDYKLAWMERLRAHAAMLLAEERVTILAGDYNVIPRDDDVFSATRVANDALIQPETRAQYRALLAQGWTDAIRALHSDETIYTFWDYQMGAWQRNLGFRIDHFLLSPRAADRTDAAGVDKDYRAREKASDHAPTWVELRA